MSRFPIAIEHYMSSVLVVIHPTQPISEAIRLMRLHGIRHLPVVTRQGVVGILSLRDIYLMESVARGPQGAVAVAEAMVAEPYTVEPDEPIDRVAREMVRRRIGTALVTHGTRLLGMFTASDALLALAALVVDERVPGHESSRETTAAPSPKKASKPTRPMPKRRTRVASRSKSSS